jgi:hypothetical protein
MSMFVAGGAFAAEAGTTCRTSHNLVGACFTVHGRLFEAATAPRVRIEATGSKEIFAVLDRRALAGTTEIIPAAVNALLMAAPSGTGIDGDYEVCPFEKDMTGLMRAVCIQNAGNLSTRRR